MINRRTGAPSKDSFSSSAGGTAAAAAAGSESVPDLADRPTMRRRRRVDDFGRVNLETRIWKPNWHESIASRGDVCFGNCTKPTRRPMMQRQRPAPFQVRSPTYSAKAAPGPRGSACQKSLALVLQANGATCAREIKRFIFTLPFPKPKRPQGKAPNSAPSRHSREARDLRPGPLITARGSRPSRPIRPACRRPPHRRRVSVTATHGHQPRAISLSPPPPAPLFRAHTHVQRLFRRSDGRSRFQPH
jgi:hypothetical protein